MTKGIFYIHHAIINEIFVVGLKGLDISEVGSSTVQFAPASKSSILIHNGVPIIYATYIPWILSRLFTRKNTFPL